MLVEVCKDYQTLKYKLSSVVDRAHAVTVAQFIQHHPENIQKALTRVSVLFLLVVLEFVPVMH